MRSRTREPNAWRGGGPVRDRTRFRCLFGLLCLAAIDGVQVGAADEGNVDLRPVFAGAVPRSLVELQAMEAHVQQLATRTLPATVAVQVGNAQGSGVIVTGDGYVLTAAHVAMESGRGARIILHDGAVLRARTLGLYKTLDAGLIKITETPPAARGGAWPHVEMGSSTELKPGQWCIASGHPGGYQADRPSPIRLGRILAVNEGTALTTDCTLIGGDSGGPLFDMEGRVIGIHSRIGNPLTANLHVPVNAFRAEWERLKAAESWGHIPGEEPFIGVQGDADAADARIARVFPGTPAADAGLESGDVVLEFGGQAVATFTVLQQQVANSSPGDRVNLRIRRGEEIMDVKVVIGARRSD